MKLIDELRERPSTFECSTYKALQAGTANKHQQQSAASGIVIAHAKFDKAATALTTMQDREATLIRALNGIANALSIGPLDSVSTWRSLANACQKTAVEALGTSGLVEP